jgi:hypothetical protein
MQTGLTLQQLAARIEGDRELKADYIAPASKLRVSIQDDKTPVLEIPSIGSSLIRPVAHGQLAELVGIPKKYYDRMREEAPDLMANNVNEWFSRFPSADKRMVRTLGGDTRALMSNRYQRIENEEIAEVSLPILAATPGIKIVSCQVTETRMYIQAVTDRIQGEVKVGDVVQAGVMITNSEVGWGAAVVSPLVYRLRCLNGMVANDGRLRQFHIGRPQADTETLLRDDTKRAEDKATLLKVRDFVTAALSEAAFKSRIDKMRELTGAKIEGDPAEAVTMLAKKVGAGEGERAGILRSLIEGADLSAWGMLNAVTAQAHTIKDYDRSVEFEVAGGQLLDLAPGEWRQILTAA